MTFDMRRARAVATAFVCGIATVLALVLIATFGSVLLDASCAPRPASAARWVRLAFTAPADSVDGVPGSSRVQRYELQRMYAGQEWAPARLYRAVGDTSDPTPAAPGSPETLLVSVSEAEWVWRSGGTALRLRSLDGSGNASRWAILAVAVAPDTTWSTRGTAPIARSRLNGVPAFAAAAADTGSVWLEHFETTQERARARICELYGFACRRGVRDTAWCGGGR